MSETDFKETDISFYEPPSTKDLINAKIDEKYFFSYFNKWIPQENYYYCVENTGFKTNKERSEESILSILV